MRLSLFGSLCVLLCLGSVGCAIEFEDDDIHTQENVAAAREGLRLDQLPRSCSSAGTEGISAQLIEEMFCLNEGKLVPFEHSNITLSTSRVHPYLSPEGKRMVLQVAASNRVTINSGLRTIAEQYKLSRGCAVVATPGTSNHETGRAIDVQNYSSINSRLLGAGFARPLPSSDPVHYVAPGEDLRSTSILAFQRLWNANNPGDRIAEDGITGPQTLGKLAASPAEGFPIGRVCEACEPVAETCNGLDDDCDGMVDDGVLNACGRCGAVPAETCNDIDDDCDGSTDEGLDCSPACEPMAESCNEMDDDCDDAVDEGLDCDCEPVAETCNEMDEDCDNAIDEGLDCDGGGGGEPPAEGDVASIAVSAALPQPMDVGVPFEFDLVVTNGGELTWTSESHYAITTGAGMASDIDVRIVRRGGDDVAPGGMVTHRVTVTPLSAGVHELRIEWRAGAAVLAAYRADVNANVAAFSARIAAVSFPMNATGGQSVSGNIVVENLGTDAWEPGQVIVQSLSNPAPFGSPTVVSIDQAVASGSSATIDFEITAPPVDAEVFIQDRWAVVWNEARSPAYDVGLTIWPNEIPGGLVERGFTPPNEVEGCSVSAGDSRAAWLPPIALAVFGLVAFARRRRR